MSTVVEIEHAIEKLPPAKLKELTAWLDEYVQMMAASEASFLRYDKEEESA
jgi:hypothetical protein